MSLNTISFLLLAYIIAAAISVLVYIRNVKRLDAAHLWRSTSNAPMLPATLKAEAYREANDKIRRRYFIGDLQVSSGQFWSIFIPYFSAIIFVGLTIVHAVASIFLVLARIIIG